MWKKKIISLFLGAVLLIGCLAQAVPAETAGNPAAADGPNIPVGAELDNYDPERDGYYGYLKMEGGEGLLQRMGSRAGYLPVLVYGGEVYAEGRLLAQAAGLGCVQEGRDKLVLSAQSRYLTITAGSGTAVYNLMADADWNKVLLSKALELHAEPVLYSGRFYVPVDDVLDIFGVEAGVSGQALSIGEVERNILDLTAELYGQNYRSELDRSMEKARDSYYGRVRSALMRWFSSREGFFKSLVRRFFPADEEKAAANELVSALDSGHAAGLSGEAAKNCTDAVSRYLVSRAQYYRLTSSDSMTRVIFLMMPMAGEQKHVNDLRLANEAMGRSAEDIQKLIPDAKRPEGLAETLISSAVTPAVLRTAGTAKVWENGASAQGVTVKFYARDRYCGSVSGVNGSFERVTVPLPAADSWQTSPAWSFRLYANLSTPADGRSALVYTDTSVGSFAILPEAKLGMAASGTVSALGSTVPVPGAQVRLYGLDNGVRVSLAAVFSDENGRYYFGNIPAYENYLVVAEKGGFKAEAGFTGASAYAGGPQLSLAGALQGSIKSADGQVLPHAKVIMSKDGRSYTAITDQNGRYTINGLAVGNYIISVSKPGYRQAATNYYVSQAGTTMAMGDILLQKETPTQNATVRMSTVFDTVAGSMKIISAEIRTEGAVPDPTSVVWTTDAPETAAFWGDNLVRKVRDNYYIVSRTLTITEPGEYEVATSFGGRTSSDIFRVEPAVRLRVVDVGGFTEVRVETTLSSPDAAFLEKFLKSIRLTVSASSGRVSAAGERLEINGDGKSGAFVTRLNLQEAPGATVNILARTKAGQVVGTAVGAVR